MLPKGCRGKSIYTMALMVIVALVFTKGCTVSTVDISNIKQWKAPVSLPKKFSKVSDTKALDGTHSYVVNGKRYWLKPVSIGYRETGIASWYGKKFHGRQTANQEVYNMYEFTAAHKSLPLPSYIKVVNHNNKKSVTVRVNDRGPFVEGRIVDLSYAAAKQIGIDKAGLAPVTIEVVDIPGQKKHPVKVSYTSGKNKISYIQVGTYKEIANAFNVMRSLKIQNLRPRLTRTSGHGATDMHYIRLGPFNTPRELDRVGKLLNRSGFKDYRVFYK